MIALMVHEIAGQDAIPLLIPILRDAEPWPASEAAVALDRLGSDRGVEWVRARVKGEVNAHQYDRQYGFEALGRCSDKGLRATCEDLFENAKGWERWQAAVALSRMGDEKAAMFIRQELATDSFLKWKLAELGERRWTQDFIRLLADDKPDAVRAAIRGLGNIGTRECAEALMRLIEKQEGDTRNELRLDAVRALGRFGSQNVGDFLFGLREKGDLKLTGAAGQAIQEIAGAATPIENWRQWWEYYRDELPADVEE